MLHAPLFHSTAKLDISLLLKSSPSPPPPNTHPPISRSISVPASGSQLPVVSSPSTSVTSQTSASTATLNPYSAVSQQQQQQQTYNQQQQQQTYNQRRSGPLLPAPVQGSGSSISKRPPPTNTLHSASPAKKHNSKWGPDEDALIISLRGGGMKWEDISKRLPGRSVIACRLHYQNYLERRSPWDEEKKDKLARLYDRMKPEMWAKVAEDLQVPWRAAEAMHWALGEAEMAKRAGVVPFSMAPAGYGETSTATAASSSSSTSGVDISGYTEPSSAQDYGASMSGRARSGMGQSNTPSEASEGGIRLGLRERYSRGRFGESEMGAGMDEDVEMVDGRPRRRRVPSGSGDQGVGLPSLAEFEGGVPAYAGFVGDVRIGRVQERERGGSQEEEEEEDERT